MYIYFHLQINVVVLLNNVMIITHLCQSISMFIAYYGLQYGFWTFELCSYVIIINHTFTHNAGLETVYVICNNSI